MGARTIAAALIALAAAGSTVLFGQAVIDPGDAAGPALTVAERPVRCSDYLDYVRSDAAGFERGLDRGQYGPRHALPALALFASTGDPALARGIKQTLRHYGDWLDGEIAAKGGVFSLEGGPLLALYQRELRKRGQLDAGDAQWFRQTLLKLRRYEYANAPGDGQWRGFQHRAVAQGMNNLLAATLYPDEPQARQWRTYGEQVWGDWWTNRDIGINDISYFSDSLMLYLIAADVTGRDEAFTDPRARATVWDRLVNETSPDGALIPYGASAGWNGLAGIRIWALELAARHTRDGRYRYVAGKLMNYGRARGFSNSQQHYHSQSVEAIALAAIACDDTVAPTPPATASVVLSRPAVERLTAAQSKARFPAAGGVDADMVLTGTSIPSKLVFRSGWRPGDLFMLVEAYARHDPLNPTAILALERWSSSFTEMASEKYLSRENAVRIEDLSGTAAFAGAARGSWPAELPVGYAGMTTSVEAFGDDPLAAHGRLRVANYMGFRAQQVRDMLFIKNRFVLVRDETTFADRFRARFGPVWNTQAIGQRGANWADTWMTAHWTQDYRVADNPRWNLLTYYAPRSGAALRDLAAARPAVDQGQGAALGKMRVTQYAWQGEVTPQAPIQFVSVLVPHSPRSDAGVLANSIEVLRDEPGLAAVSIRTAGGWELAVLNSAGRRITLPGPAGTIATDAEALYVAVRPDGRIAYSADKATTLTVGAAVSRQSAARSGFVAS